MVWGFKKIIRLRTIAAFDQHLHVPSIFISPIADMTEEAKEPKAPEIVIEHKLECIGFSMESRLWVIRQRHAAGKRANCGECAECQKPQRIYLYRGDQQASRRLIENIQRVIHQSMTEDVQRFEHHSMLQGGKEMPLLLEAPKPTLLLEAPKPMQ